MQSENYPLPIVDKANNSSFLDVFERNLTTHFNETDLDQFLVSNAMIENDLVNIQNIENI